jgi:glutathione S-transferase
MSRLVFYGNRESGHSYKVALALTLLGLPYEYRAIDLATPRASRPDDFRAASRFGEVPALVAEDRAPIVQSNAILLYLAGATGRLQGAGDMERVTEWLFWETNRIGFSLPNLRYARTFAADTPADVIAWMERRTRADLDRLDAEFAGGRRFLLGEDVSIADLSCCGYLFWPEQAGLDLGGWPGLLGWLDRIRALPGWKPPYELLA